ncbi:transposase [Reticulibacter mediterranei]|uniref:Transposase n=1 Tax=Reticulibacter mediterranei TaxID=2778369 RepID=A0A8J3N8U3_9CHLR|nr:ISL3 family transposase [Reticulibacter mediterranei]GHO98597.1 transposase [Reticulibacter mediterranei]
MFTATTRAHLPTCLAGEKNLRLLVLVRRFFCQNEVCSRKIFAERLPDLTSVYARRTTRCKEILAELGFALGGKAAAALGSFLGLRGSRMTILRLLRQTSAPAVSTPKMLGIDEWAYRRGKKYGALLIDLEKGTPVDLLPDRHAASVETWLKNHPGVQLISRDRGGEFARGARLGAPEALQTADRFHVFRNLAEVAEKILGKHRRALKAIHLVTKPAASASPLLRHQRPERERRKQQARAKLVERYEAVQLLAKQGLSHKEISRRLHLHRESVIRYARAKTFPERTERPVHPGILAPYETYLRTRWVEGEHNAVGLFREVTTRGYRGSRMTIERFLLGLRRMEQQGIEVSQTATSVELTPRRAVGLMLRCGIDLDEEERLALEQVCQTHPQVKHLNTLFQQFAQMLRDRRGEDLDQWLHAAFHSGIPELRAFVNKLRQDQQAVQAGLVLKWNNGMVEGHVNRLKFLKRSMYGRANFDLLRLRVLHHRKCA